MMPRAPLSSRSARAIARPLLALAVLTAGALGCSPAPRLAPWNDLDLGAHHAQVDHLLDAGKTDEARAALEQLFRTLTDSGAATSSTGRQAMQDVAYRLGNLALERKDHAGAAAYCDRGLSLGIGQDLFSANLLVLRGTAREELHRSAEAAADLHQALLINEALLGKAIP